MGQSTRSSVAQIFDAWYPICRSEDLKSKPLAQQIYGRPFVVFRSGSCVSALEDRCPHRNVPLSQGNVVDGNLECVYHGWQFAADGQCVKIPGLCDHTDVGARRVSSFPVREAQGFVWLWPSVKAPDRPPFELPEFSDPRYAAIDIDVEAEASLQQTIENALDVPHTAFLHRGLFRTGKGRTIDVRIVSGPDRVEAIYQNEPAPDGVVGRILAPNGGVVEHSDRFILPSIQQVEYRIGDDAHVLITGLCLPVEERRTKMFVRIHYFTPLPNKLVGTLLKPIGLRIFKQDADILKAQSLTIARFGEERFSSTPLDVLGGRVLRLMRAQEAGILDTLEVEEERTLTMHI